MIKHIYQCFDSLLFLRAKVWLNKSLLFCPVCLLDGTWSLGTCPVSSFDSSLALKRWFPLKPFRCNLVLSLSEDESGGSCTLSLYMLFICTGIVVLGRLRQSEWCVVRNSGSKIKQNDSVHLESVFSSLMTKISSGHGSGLLAQTEQHKMFVVKCQEDSCDVYIGETKQSLAKQITGHNSFIYLHLQSKATSSVMMMYTWTGSPLDWEVSSFFDPRREKNKNSTVA